MIKIKYNTENKEWRRLNNIGGEIVYPPYYISLGRREWYVPFSKIISKILGKESYLLDFLQFKYSDPHSSLFYFINGADRIDIYLKGISYDQLKHSAQRGYCVKNRIDLGWCPYMSLWEINQIIYKHLQEKCYWYVSDEMLIEEAFEALGNQVKLNRIFDSINIRDSEAMRFKGIAGFDMKKL